jgi:hypothetical protein
MRRLNVANCRHLLASGNAILGGRGTKGSSIEEFGICSKTGIIYNPFGQKPEWALQKAEKLKQQFCLTNAKEALI